MSRVVWLLGLAKARPNLQEVIKQNAARIVSARRDNAEREARYFAFSYG
jgi:hypothetical protein